MSKRQKAADVLSKIASEGKDLSVAVKPPTAKVPVEDATLHVTLRGGGFGRRTYRAG